jgi:C4-dicarboxylate-specific signal transduction histidine kinase
VSSPLRILLLENNDHDAELIQELLQGEYSECEVIRAQTRTEFISGLESAAINLILADYKLPSFDGLSALKLARNVRADLPFIFVSGSVGEDMAIEAIKIGATDYVMKSRLSRLVPSAQRALLEAQERADRKKAEEALRTAQAELARVGRLTTMGELVASIAHEISQPLAAMVASGNACLRWLAKEQPQLDEARRAAERIVSDGHRAGDVLKSASALAGACAQNMTELDINDAIREVLSLTLSEFQEYDISLDTELSGGLAPIMGDRVRLQQVILNLVMNAIEAMSMTPSVSRDLRVRSHGDGPGTVRIVVEDSGPGVSPETMDRVFEAFFTTKLTGMGMGLPICRSIINAHGGRLWVSPKSPRGAVFQFTLPAAVKRGV